MGGGGGRRVRCRFTTSEEFRRRHGSFGLPRVARRARGLSKGRAPRLAAGRGVARGAVGGRRRARGGGGQVPEPALGLFVRGGARRGGDGRGLRRVGERAAEKAGEG